MFRAMMGSNTICYQCGSMVVQRQGYSTLVLGLEGSKCKYCGAELNSGDEGEFTRKVHTA
jgi:hypothetical protein